MNYMYEYERIQSNCVGIGAFKGVKYRYDGVQDIIQRRAKKGWRYVGFIPVLQTDSGNIEIMDLVFECIVQE